VIKGPVGDKLKTLRRVGILSLLSRVLANTLFLICAL
jgi:hypothetical protein